MPSYVPPKKNTELIFYVGLVSQSDTKTFQTNPTIAVGDFKVSTDGGAFDNLDTIPAVTPAGGKAVKITLSASEMNGDNVLVVCSDAAGAEWCDLVLSINPSVNQIDDIRTDTAASLADTNELQTDWADGGRLDVILDSAAVKTGYSLSASGLDSVLIESGISAGDSLTNDTGTQITSVNARQAIAAILSAGAGVLSGVSSNAPAFKPGGKASGNTRIIATVTSDGRTAVTLKVPD